jgi:membrane-bound serine protease (ClpP class)
VIALGVILVVFGAAFAVAEAHVPGGVLGAIGGLCAVVGGVVLIGEAGGGTALAVPVAVGIALVVFGWTLFAMRSAAAVRRGEARTGREALCGRVGVVRQWDEPAGHVFVEGALWRAQRSWGEDDPEALHTGDPVVVENVDGLTLSVRAAEPWELVT